jgi:nitronate monooxygenase
MVVTSAPRWTSTRLTERFRCRYPIVQGPMGGGASTPELVAAVSNAGGLGSLGCYHLEPAAILRAAAEIRRLTDRPFNLNLWIPREREDVGSLGAPEAARALARLQPYRDELGLPPLAEPPAPTVQDFEQQFEAVLEARPAAFSFIFGLLPAPLAAEARRRGITLIGTATTVDEAEALEESGVDLVVASGFEAGGHRGSFLRAAEQSLTGTFSLVPQVVSAVRVPVLAAGGIADGRGVAAALVLGASAAQIGTAFLLCRESGASDLHRTALARPHPSAANSSLQGLHRPARAHARQPRHGRDGAAAYRAPPLPAPERAHPGAPSRGGPGRPGRPPALLRRPVSAFGHTPLRR